MEVSGTRRSWLGILSCLLWLIATVSIGLVIVGARTAEEKMAGLEMFIVGPFGLILLIAGFGAAYVGTKDRIRNPLSRAGFALNGTTLGLIALLILGGVLRSA